MKKIKFLVLIMFVLLSTSHSNIWGQDTDILQRCEQDTILRDLNIPLLEIWTKDGVEPTARNVDAPSGLWGTSVVDNEYVYARMAISLKDSVLYDSGVDGMKIRLRGNTSNLWGKKPYKLKLSKKRDLLFRGIQYEDKDWVLKAVYDGLITRVYTGLEVGRQVGLDWSPGCRLVNLVINGNYKGDYLLFEIVEREQHRVKVEKSGYIIEDDAYWWNEDVYFKSNVLPRQVGYTFKYPDPENVNDRIIENIRSYIWDFEVALLEGGDISRYIDIDNWAAWLLAQDILGQSDAAGTNWFLYKEDYDALSPGSTLLKMGPLWDFDGAFEINDKWSDIHRVEYSFYFGRLLQREDFFSSYVALWDSVRSSFSMDGLREYLNNVLDNSENGINNSRILGSNLFYDDWYTPIEDEIEFAIDWMSDRIKWIDEQLKYETSIEIVEGDCAKSVGIYNVYGQRLPSIPRFSKGIYIIDGKKVLIK